jgi:hypothetical protein
LKKDLTNKFNILKYLYFIINFLNMETLKGNEAVGGEEELKQLMDLLTGETADKTNDIMN